MHTSVMYVATYQVHTKRRMPGCSFQGHHRERIFISTRTSDLPQEEEGCQRVRNISTETFLSKMGLSIPSSAYALSDSVKTQSVNNSQDPPKR